ncbi:MULTISPECIES: glycosyltransferase family 9 protein [unclassified Flavobacterium]|uniref:glycosyltransferase family 9 protein n=1 Tax=unclassified Flavobacterium TaxID=196869 RepID=UPI001291CB59|nr:MULTISPECIES: glycosyltransferase family 9 protein [unclassified Flavobacterium]MQP51509.1 ADP-heptose--LPS heptosyltransferase RfaF [Flavobacterium sp. LMO9]MQP61263.1 ADP-heptose--LPS heptosyltransferase RfaF [Flavobacterium sp. LMO6]
MGDVAMTVSVLRALVLQYPDVKITVVSRPFFQPFFDGIPNVNFFGVDLNKRHKGFLGLLRLFSDLRKLDIHFVADLHNVLRSKVIRTLFTLSGKKVAATDKGRTEKKALVSLTKKVFAPVKPMVDRHVDTFKQLGFSIDLTNARFPEKAVLSEEILSITGIKNQDWIGIAPFAQYESKVYPLDLMQEVIDELANKNYKIFLFGGGEKEIQLLNQLQNNHNNVVVLAGKLQFKQEIEVISNLDVMLSMDSGNSHIAAMLGVKVITLWGATHPYAGFKPFNQPDDFCITSDRNKFPLLPTSIYGNKKVEGYEDVMRTISPETIVEKIKKS